MAACGLRENEPQMNADEYGYTSVTYFSAIYRKGHKELKEKRQESLRSKYQPAPWLNAMMWGG